MSNNIDRRAFIGAAIATAAMPVGGVAAATGASGEITLITPSETHVMRLLKSSTGSRVSHDWTKDALQRTGRNRVENFVQIFYDGEWPDDIEIEEND